MRAEKGKTAWTHFQACYIIYCNALLHMLRTYLRGNVEHAASVPHLPVDGYCCTAIQYNHEFKDLKSRSKLLWPQLIICTEYSYTSNLDEELLSSKEEARIQQSSKSNSQQPAILTKWPMSAYRKIKNCAKRDIRPRKLHYSTQPPLPRVCPNTLSDPEPRQNLYQ